MLALACLAIILGPLFGTTIAIVNGTLSADGQYKTGNVGDTLNVAGNTTDWTFFANYIIEPFRVILTDVSAECVNSFGCLSFPFNFSLTLDVSSYPTDAVVTVPFSLSVDGHSTGATSGSLFLLGAGSALPFSTPGGDFSAGPASRSDMVNALSGTAYYSGKFTIDSLGYGETVTLPSSAEIDIAQVPEPAAGVLAVSGLALLALLRRRQIRRRSQG